jgi:hypothetical protein
MRFFLVSNEVNKIKRKMEGCNACHNRDLEMEHVEEYLKLSIEIKQEAHSRHEFLDSRFKYGFLQHSFVIMPVS